MKKIEREKARELRRAGMAVGSIASDLGVAKSSVSTWVRDIKLSSEKREELFRRHPMRRGQFDGALANQKRAEERHACYRDEGRELAEKDEGFRLICALYWGEGQRSTKNVFAVSNSDPAMLRIVGRWLVSAGHDERMMFRVQYYEENGLSEEEIRSRWMEWLQFLKYSHMRKFTVCKTNRASQKKRVGRLPYGTAILTVCCTKLVQMVFGGIEFLRERSSDG